MSTVPLAGYPAKFNRLSQDLGGFKELLEPHAFRAVLRSKPDTVLNVNHDANWVLARTTSGTMSMSEDVVGLRFRADLDPEDPQVQSVRVKIRRKDLTAMSFAFLLGTGGDEWLQTDQGVVRRILPDGVAGLLDVAVVAHPAYLDTSVGFERSMPLNASTSTLEFSEEMAQRRAQRRWQQELDRRRAGRPRPTTPTPRATSPATVLEVHRRFVGGFSTKAVAPEIARLVASGSREQLKRFGYEEAN